MGYPELRYGEGDTKRLLVANDHINSKLSGGACRKAHCGDRGGVVSNERTGLWKLSSDAGKRGGEADARMFGQETLAGDDQ